MYAGHWAIRRSHFTEPMFGGPGRMKGSTGREEYSGLMTPARCYPSIP
jgi:hypothetical protein